MFPNLFFKYKTLGGKLFLLRAIHWFCALVGVKWEKSVLLTQTIDIRKVNDYLNSHSYVLSHYTPIVLDYNDFINSNKIEFNEKKMEIIRLRFKDRDDYIAYGIVNNGYLAYSCWVYKKELVLSYNKRLSMNEDVLFMDDFCDPSYRGQGIHTYMNFYRLSEVYNKGFKTAAVLVHSYNKSALKSQITAGFKFDSTIIVINLFGKIFTFKKLYI